MFISSKRRKIDKNCCASECRNRGEDGYRLFSVPTGKNDDHRKKSVPFSKDTFEINQKDNEKLLKKSTVPTRSLKRKFIDDEPRNLKDETFLSVEVISSKQGNTSVQISCSKAEINASESNESYVTKKQFQKLQNKLKAAEVNSFNSYEKHTSLLLDEVVIKPGLQYDNSTKTVIRRATMMLSGSKDVSNILATHSLVFMLAVSSTRWKQTIRYKFMHSRIAQIKC
ncbi:hypothetical protein RN001_007833 [Aquatica leii]|uniref:Transposable element P transposase-like RNase H domain-containing protein n=1 Tax=Aquatica leii TaxID=1421715 RepID=A0AAN7P8W0_9COLE|nr:hypothetical protein RN001_007833 [Aquatica leii]